MIHRRRADRLCAGAVFTLALGACLVAPSVAGAVDAVSSASQRAVAAGTEGVSIWIVGRGFQAGATVTISGDGVSSNIAPQVVPEASRVDGGRGDGIIYTFDLDLMASLGARDITVTNPDGSNATGSGIFEVLAGMAPPDPPPDPMPGDPDAGMMPEPMPEPMPPPAGVVDVVTRASPRFGERGAQVNLWIVGRQFAPNATIAFNDPAMGPAAIDGEVLGYELTRNAESENGEYDGITYFLRIGGETQAGPKDITITNPDGSSATGQGVFTVVEPGMVPPPQPGDGDVDGISGASPRAVRAGNHVSLWIYGDGFQNGATVEFSNPGIRAYAAPQVVLQSQSHPGFSGIRNFLIIEPDAQAGPVQIRVTNPNGTQAVGQGLLDIVGAAGGPGGEGPPQFEEVEGPCPDLVTPVESIDRVVPSEAAKGELFNMAIVGRGFGCGASIVITGGGLTAVDRPRLVASDPVDPLNRTLFWQVEVAADAREGARDVTVVNPNGTTKTLPGAFQIVAAEGGKKKDGGFQCATRPSETGPFALLMLLALPLMLRRRRR